MNQYQNIKVRKGFDFSDSEGDEPQPKQTGGRGAGSGAGIGAMDSLLNGMFNKGPVAPRPPPKQVKVQKKEPQPPVKVVEKPQPPKVVEKPQPPPVRPEPKVQPQPKVTPSPPPPKVQPQNVQVPIKPSISPEDTRIPQPQSYVFPSGIPQNEGIIPVSDDLFNRPGYLRKLKKIADNFDFNRFNQKNTAVLDVLRLSECYYSEIKKRKQGDFSDFEFPANYSAFVDNSKEKKIGTFAQINHWNHAIQSFKGPCFGKYIDPNDIERGAFHSEYLISCLASLAENERNIKRLIEQQELTKTNFYYVRINENGVWRYIIVDDQIAGANNGKLAISHSYSDVETELWPSLIEKAYTKLYGTFEQYSRNQSRQSYLRDLTGAPVRTYLPNSVGLVDRIKQALSNGYVVQAVPNAKIQDKGLNPNLTLSVIGVNNRGSYEIRNSFGTLDQKPKFTISKDGIFELSQADVLQNIAYFLISEIHTDYATSTVQCKMKSSFYSSYSFKVKQDFHGYLMVSQFDERLFPNSHNVFTDKSNINIENPSQYSYSPIRALIYQKERNGEYTYVNAGYSDRKAFDIEVNLDAGEYVVILLALWNSDWYDVNFSLYGTELVTFKKLYNKFDPTIIGKGLQEDALANGTKLTRSGVQELLYLHEPSGLIVLTLNNSTGRQTRHTKDFARSKTDSLFLLTNKNKGQNWSSLSKEDIILYKETSFEDKQWWVDLEVNEKWTWVFATEAQFDDAVYRSLGGK